MSLRRPKLVVFDLDGTLWVPEMYELWGSGGAPFAPHPSGDVVDRGGTRVRLMGNSRAVLRALATDRAWAGTRVAVASRTDEPGWADECMRKMIVARGEGNGEPAAGGVLTVKECVDVEEVYKGSKVRHFENLKRKTGVSFDDMMFFDNEWSNCRDVSDLGVFCVYVARGMTDRDWEKALVDFSKTRVSL